MNYTIKIYQTIPIAYMRRIGSYGIENYTLMENFKKWLHENNRFHHNTVIYGIPRDDMNTIDPELCRYDVGIKIEREFTDKELKIGIIEGGRYLVFKIEHTADEISNFWNEVFHILEKEEYYFDNSRFIVERYDNKLIKKGYCEFCVPIE